MTFKYQKNQLKVKNIFFSRNYLGNGGGTDIKDLRFSLKNPLRRSSLSGYVHI